MSSSSESIGYVPHPDEEPSDHFAKWLLSAQIIGAIFLQKIAVPLGGDTQLFLEFFILLGLVGIGAFTGRLEIRKVRLAFYLWMVGGMTLIQVIGGREFSLSSLLLLLIIHLPYIFGLKPHSTRPGIELVYYQKIMALLAVLGMVQFGIQFIIGWKYAFFVDTQLPKQLIMSGYNNLNTVRLGSGIYKSNGVFMLEPAMFCQFLALSIVIEMAYFKRMKFLLLYIAAIFTTFSGTGLVILGLIAPAYLIINRKFLLMIAIALGLLGIILFAPLLGLEDYVSRVNEFSDKHSSGFARFVSVFPIIHDYILPQMDTLLFGLGAGANKTIGDHVSYEVHLPSWGKIWLEYGLVGFAFYLPLMLHVLFAARRSGYLKAALTIQYFFDGYVLIPTMHGIILALLGWPATDEKVEQEKLDARMPPQEIIPPGLIPFHPGRNVVKPPQ